MSNLSDDGALDDFLGSLDFTTDPQLDLDPQPEVMFEEYVPVDPLKIEPDEQLKGDGICVSCGSATFRPPGLTKAGHKKRVPKLCDNCRPDVQVPPFGPNTKGVESQLQRVQQELADDIRLLATLAGPLLPVTGMYLFNQADPFTLAIIKLAKNNQGILRVLHRAAQVAPIYTVAETLAGSAYAVQVDLQKADPHNAIARRLRVEQAYDTVFPTGQTAQDNVTWNEAPTYTVQ